MTETSHELSTQEMALSVLATLHIIPYLRWERENDLTFEAQRANLLDTLARISGQLRSEGGGILRHLLLGGQTVILEDIANLRSDLLTFLLVCNATKRVEVGPWYVQPDEMVVSGEALIRNLLMARYDADKYGVRLPTAAYTPDPGGHVGQLPQILQGFGIDAVFVHHGAKLVHLPFRWESPDGSSVLAISHDTPLRQNAALSVHDQRVMTPDGPFLWMASADETDKLKPAGISNPMLQSSLEIYVAALRAVFADALRPVLKGELRLQAQRENGYLLPGTLSARIHLKQMNTRLQNLLTYTAEPWLALALTHGKVEANENVRSLLAYSWRNLLKNQSRAALGGYASDAVADEVEVRFRQVEDTTKYVVDRSMRALPGTPGTKVENDRTYVVVWNPHNWSIKQAVDIKLELPLGMLPTRVSAPPHGELPFSWEPETHRLTFVADVPAVGYATYTVSLGAMLPAEAIIQRSTAAVIASRGSTLSIEDGSLIWRYGGAEINNLLRFMDGGDAGDVFNYSPPKEDVIEQGTLVSGIQAESTPLYERLIFRHRMRIAPSLRADRNRERGVRLLEFTTSATFYDGMSGLYFKTDFTNTAEDHRLRVHLRTGIKSSTVLADSAFSLVERPIQLEGDPFAPASKWEGVTSTYPMLGVCAVQDINATMALFSRGLPEFEAIPEDDQTTLALTLLRAVGWISRDDLRTRTAAIGMVRAAPGAQCLRPMSAEYALMPLPANDPAALVRATQTYNAPVQAYQYSRPPDRLRRSYLSIQSSLGTGGDSDGNGAILTSLKPPHYGRGWLLRLFNPTSEPVEVHVTPNVRPRYVRTTNLAEDSQNIIEPDGNGTINVTLPPQKLVTLRIGFG